MPPVALDAIRVLWDITDIKKSERLMGGAFNDTWRIDGPQGPMVLQRLRATEDQAIRLAHNLDLINDISGCPMIHFIPTKDGDITGFYDGSYWRFSWFAKGKVINALTDLEAGERPSYAEQLGKVFGKFHTSCIDIEPEMTRPLYPNYRKPWYHLQYLWYILAGKKVPLSLSTGEDCPMVEIDEKRYQATRAFIELVLRTIYENIDLFNIPWELPLRVCHGDPKPSNAIVTDDDGIVLCDPDTIMATEGAHDFWEGLRWMVNLLGKHPDSEYQRVDMMTLDLVSARAYAQGFLEQVEKYEGASARKRLEEVTHDMVMVYVMIQLMRDLADFLVGDRYYNNQGFPPNIGLYRARVQYQLLKMLLELKTKGETIIA